MHVLLVLLLLPFLACVTCVDAATTTDFWQVIGGAFLFIFCPFVALKFIVSLFQ